MFLPEQLALSEPGRPPEEADLTSVAPSIFVPITSDLAAPFEKPQTNRQRIEQLIASTEAHAAAVKANILRVLNHERILLVQDGKNREKAYPDLLENSAGLADGEFEILIQSVEAPRPQFDPSLGPRLAVPAYNPDQATLPRDYYSRRVLELADDATRQLDAYDARINSVLDQYRRALTIEIQKEKLESERAAKKTG